MRLAFVTPRYGGDIRTGAEHACRLLAEHVSDRHDVDVLTTCASDSLTWKNEATEGTDRVRGVLVRRFSVTQAHDRAAFARFSEQLFSQVATRAEELEWVRQRGPWSPGLIDHLRRQHRNYDVIVFFSLSHATTVHGATIAPDRTIIFPYLTLKPALRFGLWRDLLESARGIGYLSPAERRLMRGYVRAAVSGEDVVGIGVDSPQQHTYPRHQQDPADNAPSDDEAPAADETATTEYLDGRGIPFRRRHRLYGPIAFYAGRVAPDNGSEEMLEYFDSYSASDGDAALVLMGVKMMKVPDERFIRQAGVLPERERMMAYEAADVTIAPGAGDLVSESLLQSLAVGTPVLANAANVAAVDHLRRANGGLYYANREEFVATLGMLMSNTKLRDRLGENGRQYIKQNYRWDHVLSRFDRLCSRVRSRA